METRKEVCNAKSFTELRRYLHRSVQFIVCRSSVKFPVLCPTSTSFPCRIWNKLFEQVSVKRWVRIKNCYRKCLPHIHLDKCRNNNIECFQLFFILQPAQPLCSASGLRVLSALHLIANSRHAVGFVNVEIYSWHESASNIMSDNAISYIRILTLFILAMLENTC